MFEQSMVEGSARTNRGWPVVASLMLQFSVLSVAILVPLVNPELLPKAFLREVFRVAPPLPPAPRPMNPTVRTADARPPRHFGPAPFLAPTGPIKPVRLLVDEPPAGVPSMDQIGVPNGVENSVLTNLVRDAHAVTPPPPPPPPVRREPERAKEIPRLRIGGTVQDAQVISRVPPAYPRLALQTRQEGKVSFTAVIGRDGTIQQLQVLSGHPMFVQAATEAVRQWRYRPTLLNGEPVEVITTIEVTFHLNR